ncbi:MAG: MotA/TolQ/ExbB proton channel family protein [Lentisphaerales bacterium]|nr:MotA/TolQ/ExbB proton channel family protein [Lentisphaerales bacterium]
MSTNMKKVWTAAVSFMCLYGTQLSLFAQDEAPAEGAQKTAGFMTIVFGGDIVSIAIWMMLFGASAATLAFIIDAMISIKRDKLIPEDLVEGVRESLNEGDLNSAIAACEENPSPLSNILMVGFSNITEGFEVIQDSISSASEYESEKLLQKVNYLNMLGQIAPMLGLLGTVTGMVAAFSGMATATGSAKATMLASAIAGALWTTCAGLLISVPALLSYTLTRNNAIRIILESESTVIDLIKTLRNAEVDAEEEEEY